MPLRTRLLLLLVLAVIPLLATQFYNELALRRDREADIHRAAGSQAQLLADELTQLVSGVEKMLVAVAQSPVLDVADTPNCISYVRQLQQAFPGVSNIGISNADGQVLCLNEGLAPGLNNKDRLYFELARDTRRFAIGEHIIGRATGRRVLTFAQPILDERTGEFRGVAYASINLVWLAEYLARKPLTPNASVTIADRRGTVLVQLPEQERGGEPLPARWIARLNEARSGVVSDDSIFGDKPLVVGYVPVQQAPEGLLIAVGVDEQPALAAINDATWRSLLTSLAALMAGLVLTQLLSRFAIRRPLDRILAALERWKKGDLTVRTQLSGRTEFAQIGQGFDEMIESLRLREQERAWTEAELRQSRDRAMQASASKTRFLASASHDLRQPLHALTLTMAALESRHRDDADTALVGRLKRAITNLAELVDTLLDVSRVDAGLVTPQRCDVDTGELFQSLTEEFGSLAEQKGVQLLVQPSQIIVHSDRSLLGTMLRNLVSNAIKFTPSGGHVMLECHEQGERVEIAVSDTGIGIPPEQQTQIFEEFLQLENPERDRRKGLGLGLNIVQRMAELLDHPVTLRSEPGRGSTFTVSVPRASGAAERSRGDGRQTAGDAAEPAPIRGRVLLIEDEELVAAATTQLLRDWGATVTRARTAEEAFTLIDTAADPIELLIADYRLPGSNGFSAIEHARRRWPALPVVLITGDMSAALVAEAAARRIRIVSKPMKPADLGALLSELLQPSGRIAG